MKALKKIAALVKVAAAVAVVAVPVDLMVRGADSFFGTWVINTMAGA